MIEAELYDGTVLEFPDGTAPDVIQRVVREQTMQRRRIPTVDARGADGVPGRPVMAGVAPKTTGQRIVDAVDYVDDTASVALRGVRRGVAEFAGLPVDLVNAGLGKLGVPVSETPFMGSDFIDTILGAPSEAAAAATGMRAEVEPQDAVQRIAGRVGREIGATAVPVGAALGVAARTGAEGARNLGPVGRYFVEPAAVAPGRLIQREATFAAGAGTGAGFANEAAGNPQDGDNFWSDFIGSLAGVGLIGTGERAVGALRNMAAGATGSPRLMDDVAGEEIVDRIINNSTEMGEQFARTGRVDTAPLARRLRTPSPVEEAVPGYVANIGDRAQDPLLQTMVQNQDMLTPGAANVRRTANDAAITRRLGEVAPQGDPAQFRAALEAGRDAQIAEALDAEEIAAAIFGEAEQGAQPALRDATARGSSLRSGLQEAYDTARSRVDEAWRPINEADAPVDIGPLAERFAGVDQRLPLNDTQRFRPAEAGVPAALAPEGSAEVPLREVTSIRGGLTDDIRTQRAAGQRNAARVTDQYRREVDQFVDTSIPPELRDQYEAARSARRDLADRFERPGTGIAETLRPREGGGYALDDSAVPGRFAQPDQGRINDTRALLREAGGDQRVRNALADEVLADVQSRGLTDKPERLRQYLDERQILLGEFPELRGRLERVGVAAEYLRDVGQASKSMQKRLTTPGRSAQASYLKYGDEATVDAVRNLTAGPKPREAARELLEAAGNTPEARRNAKAALWEVVKTKKFSAPNSQGAERWDAKKLKAMFDDPKTAAVAEELWADDPDDLAAIKELFSALAGAEGSIRTRAPNSSGTAQALSGKFDPSLSAASVASRARSVSRGVLSPSIAVVDVVSTWLRNRSKQVQARAIDQLASQAFNNPGLAADLLLKFNPAEMAARRRMLTQKYGVRATQILNLLDEAESDDPVMEAIGGN